jgi:2-C-methyl-D-erythritol 4-phosphate cytidylyltransferase
MPGASLGAVIVAAGSGVRYGDADKVLADLAGRPVIEYSLRLFALVPGMQQIVLVAAEHTRARCLALVDSLGLDQTVVRTGGATRRDSVAAGLAALTRAIGLVAVHDAARPLATLDLVERVVQAARDRGAAAPALPVSDTIHIARDAVLDGTVDRTHLRAAQTPQVARRDWLEQALARAGAVTDEAGALHAAGFPVTLVEGEAGNLKITWPRDLVIAEALLAAREARA